MLCMHIADNKVSLVKLNELDKTIDSFKLDMSKNLDNDKSLYKKFGFSRKKLLTLEGMKADCVTKDTDTEARVCHVLEQVTNAKHLHRKHGGARED